MPQTNTTKNLDWQRLGLLIMPSWLSGTVAIFGGLFLSIGTILYVNIQTNVAHAELVNSQASASARYQSLLQHVQTNEFLNNLPLLIFWALIGVIVYLFVVNVFSGLRNTVELRDEMEYVHADKRKIIIDSGLHLGLRLVAVIVWVAYFSLFFKVILPYCVAAALVAAAASSWYETIAYALLSAVVMAVALHIHAIFFRLLMLKPRVFSNAVYVD